MNTLLAYGGNIVQDDRQNKVQLLIPTGWPKVYQNQAGNTKDREDNAQGRHPIEILCTAPSS